MPAPRPPMVPRRRPRPNPSYRRPRTLARWCDAKRSPPVRMQRAGTDEDCVQSKTAGARRCALANDIGGRGDEVQVEPTGVGIRRCVPEACNLEPQRLAFVRRERVRAAVALAEREAEIA